MLFTDMPAREYHALNRISQSAIKRLLRSPAHYRAWLDAPPSPSAAMQFGTAVHSILFDPPEVRPSVLAVVPDDAPTRRSNEGKAWWANFDRLNSGKVILDAEDYARALNCADAVLAHPRARAMIDECTREVSMIWTDDESGIDCKARADLLAPDRSFVVDLKTTLDASREAFQKSIWNFRYDLQAAFYMRGVRAAAGIGPHSFVIIAVEPDPPHGVALYRIDNRATFAAEADIARGLALFAECSEMNAWPAYSDEIMPIDVPKWAQSRQSNEGF
jgi:hypothetical protein